MLSAYLQGNTETPISAAQYEQLVDKYYRVHKPYINPAPLMLSLPGTRFATRRPEPPVKWHLGYNALSLGLLIIEQLANVLAALGALLMVLRRKASLITRQIGLLGARDDLAAHADPVERYAGRRLRPGAGPAPGAGIARYCPVLDDAGPSPRAEGHGRLRCSLRGHCSAWR